MDNKKDFTIRKILTTSVVEKAGKLQISKDIEY